MVRKELHRADPLRSEVNDTPVTSPESLPSATESDEQPEGGPKYQTHELIGSGSLRKCFTCGRWFHNEGDPDAELQECDGTIQIKDRP